jgi:hypothetical protein
MLLPFYFVINIMSFGSSTSQNSCSREKCRINNLEWFALNKITMVPCNVIYKIMSCCNHFGVSIFTLHLKILFKKQREVSPSISMHLKST